MLPHHCLVAEATVSGDGFQQTDRDIVLLYALPMHHAFGLVSGLLVSVCKGSTLVMVPGTGLSISSAMVAIEKEKVTIFLGVPYIFALALNIAKKEGVKSDLASLRLCASAGASLPVDIIRQFKKYYGFDILDCWGLTEAVCLVTCPPVDGSGKLGSAGKAMSAWEVKIVDDEGSELPPNQAGEVIVRGFVMQGYYNNPQATAEVMRDGWFYSGDIGKVDRDGYLFITGRKKDIIIVKGQNIRPSDIESVLHTHPKVAEAAVIGVPDELRGEMVTAVIKLKEGEVATEQEIRRFCFERIANYKVPKQVTFLDSLPKTAAGEIDKESIRDCLSIPPLFPKGAIPLVKGIAP
jgi:long-chain acyl-CoA synthetase